MQIFWNLVFAIQIISALAMIGLVLVQHGKGADMGASFGSGASGSLFGASGSANFLSRSTSFCAAVFFSCTLGLAYFGTSGSASQRPEGKSVFERAGAASAPTAASAPPVAQIPTAPTSAPASAPATAAPAPAVPASAPAKAAASSPQKP
jgi:preprotein translocase subunit SecG